MKRTIIGLLVFLVFSIPAVAVTVVGTGSPEVDVPAVQEAVDKNDVVNLQGTFDFGEGGVVKIVKAADESLEIIGLENATIMNGGDGGKLWPWKGGTPGALSVHYENRGSVVIRDLIFQDTIFCAIMVAGGNNLEVSGCTVKDILPGSSPFGAGQWPILVLETYSVPLPYPMFGQPHSFIGDTVLVEKNTVELADGAEGQYGILAFDFGLDGESYPNIIINDNTIINKGMPGSESIGILLAGVEYPITYVTENDIENYATAGIQLKPHFAGNMPGPTYITNNNTISGAQYGIDFQAVDHAVCEGNTINASVNAHVYLNPGSYDNTFRNNTFGTLSHPPEGNAARIIIEGNDNTFELNTFTGNVRPWEEGHGVWLIKPHTAGNKVYTSELLDGNGDPVYMPDRKAGRTMFDYFKDQSDPPSNYLYVGDDDIAGDADDVQVWP